MSKELPIIDVRCRVTIPEAGENFSGRAKARGRADSIKSFAVGTMDAFVAEIGAARVFKLEDDPVFKAIYPI